MSIGGGEVEARGPEEGGATFVLEGLPPPPKYPLLSAKLVPQTFPFRGLCNCLTIQCHNSMTGTLSSVCVVNGSFSLCQHFGNLVWYTIATRVLLLNLERRGGERGRRG